MKKIRTTSLRPHQGRVFTVAALLFVIAIQFLRFQSIDSAPPGFYVDEVTSATEVMCIRQSGEDFYGSRHPLFSPSLGGGFYTPVYLYGQAAWTTVFGDSVSSYRSFIALVTVLTLLVFGLWLRRAAGPSVALWFWILASISPWCWQFSRIAWDPPLAPFFIALAIYCFTAEKKWTPYLAGVFFALAAYSYPPTRVQAGILLLLMPGVSWRDKLRSIGTFAVALIPLLLRSLEEDFKVRANLVGIWSRYPGNPYKDEDAVGLAFGVVKNFLLHLTPEFLLLRGDANLRHSTQAAGMISPLEGLGLVLGMIGSFRRKVRLAITPSERVLVWTGLLGVVTGILPAALTWESVPHALRAITTWPFFCLLAAVAIHRFLLGRPAVWKWVFLAGAIAFSSYYLDDYFNVYPERARAWYQSENHPLANAYFLMREGKSCAEARRLPLP